MLTADFTNQFKKDYKLAIKRNLDISLIDAAIYDLINEVPFTSSVACFCRYDFMHGAIANCSDSVLTKRRLLDIL